MPIPPVLHWGYSNLSFLEVIMVGWCHAWGIYIYSIFSLVSQNKCPDFLTLQLIIWLCTKRFPNWAFITPITSSSVPHAKSHVDCGYWPPSGTLTSEATTPLTPRQSYPSLRILRTLVDPSCHYLRTQDSSHSVSFTLASATRQDHPRHWLSL